MHLGKVRFVGEIAELRGANQPGLVIEVKGDAERLAKALGDAGATCDVTSPIALRVNLPADATSALVFRCARDAGIQVRGLAASRESIEAAFLRVIGETRP
jgi:hypothetical protein